MPMLYFLYDSWIHRNTEGWTEVQAFSVFMKLMELEPDEFHHGMCIGADALAHNLVRVILPDCRVIRHPPLDTSKMADLECDDLCVPLPYLLRNKNCECFYVYDCYASTTKRNTAKWYVGNNSIRKKCK